MATALNWTKFDAILFDLDGVVTPTADVHERAWTELFAAWDFTADDLNGRLMGREVGRRAWTRAQEFYAGASMAPVLQALDASGIAYKRTFSMAPSAAPDKVIVKPS